MRQETTKQKDKPQTLRLFTTYVTNEGWVFRIYKELLQINKKKKDKAGGNEQKLLTGESSKRKPYS